MPPGLLTLDGLSVKYGGRLGGNQAIRTNHPMPRSIEFTTLRHSRDGSVIAPSLILSQTFYFEVTIGDEAYDPTCDEYMYTSCVAIGLSTSNFQLKNKQPGWDKFSLGLHGDDGCLFHGVVRALLALV